MDPKALSGLDPKFRETYERVMGTPTQPTSTPAAQPPQQPVDVAPPPAPSDTGAFMPSTDPTSTGPETIVITSPAPTPTSTYDVASVSPTEGIPFSTTPAPQAPVETPSPTPVSGETAFASAPDPSTFSTPPIPPSIINPLNASEESAGAALPPLDSLLTAVGTPAPQAPPATASTESLLSQINPMTPASTPATPISPSMVTPAPAYTPENLGIQATPVAAPAMAAAAPAAAINPTGAQSPMLRILLILGGIVFFALYTIFWIKVFKLPFLF